MIAKRVAVPLMTRGSTRRMGMGLAERPDTGSVVGTM